MSILHVTVRTASQSFKSSNSWVTDPACNNDMSTLCRGTERRDFLFFKADAEVILGRFAMMGIVGLFWIPFVNVSNVGHPTAANLHHVCLLPASLLLPFGLLGLCV